MRYREIGNSGIHASVAAFGAWAIGGWLWGGTNEQTSIEAIHAAVDHGMNFIDTAPIYGYGVSESIVGKALKGIREETIIATKCGLRWDLTKAGGELHFYGTLESVSSEATDIPVYKFLAPESIRFEVEQSLKRLQTDYIDLYQTHWQESTTPIEDTMAELLKLKDEGKIRAIGVSNATTAQMTEYGGIDSAQEKFNMLERNNLDRAEFCNKNGFAFLAYSPLAQGLLTGKIKPGHKFGEGDVRTINPLFKDGTIESVNRMLDKWNPVCEKHGANLGQIAAAWTFEFPGITHVLLGTRTVEQAEMNALAGSIQLDEEDIRLIDSAYDDFIKDGE